MTLPPTPPLDYQPPQQQPKASVMPFVVGLLVGGAGTVGTFVATLVLAFASSEGSDRIPVAFAFVPPVLFVGGIVLFTTMRRTRRFGLGMLASVPLTVLATFIICGGLR